MSESRQVADGRGSGPRTQDEIFALLRQGAWFGGVASALQQQIIRRSSVRAYAKGQYIIRAGDPSKGMFALLEGRVHLVVHTVDDAEVLVHVAEPGFWFGHYALLTGKPSHGSVIAAAPSRTLLLPVAEFEAICALDGDYYRQVNRYMLSMYDYLFRYLAETQSLASERWLALRLADLSAMRRADLPTPGPVEIRVPQAELATMIGVSRQTVGQLLARLEARGAIAVKFRSVVVLDEAALRDVARRDGRPDAGNAAAAR
jgi:CRP-like cAMP-binding protein